MNEIDKEMEIFLDNMIEITNRSKTESEMIVNVTKYMQDTFENDILISVFVMSISICRHAPTLPLDTLISTLIIALLKFKRNPDKPLEILEQEK